MATVICNNGDGGFGQKLEGFYATFFRGRKPAFRSKPAKGIKIKKSIITPEKERKRERDSWRNGNGDDDDDDRSSKKKKKKRRVSSSTARVSISDFASVDEFENLGLIKEGSYGAVYRVRDKATGEFMAMKSENEGLCRTTLMEIDILKSLEPHPNVIGFKKVAADDCDGVYVLMELMETDLRFHAPLEKKEEEGFAIDEVKRLMKQLLEGVKFLHENGVMHRDLKPENILLSKSGDLKICDFGLSTRFDKESGSYSSGVGTLWYRAPELLRGVEKYSTEVYMWAVGCIMAELVLKKVLFRGEDEKDQLDEIYCILGSPYSKICSSISGAKKVLSEAGFDLLKGLLSHDQMKRTTAEEALNHVWFGEE